MPVCFAGYSLYADAFLGSDVHADVASPSRHPDHWTTCNHAIFCPNSLSRAHFTPAYVQKTPIVSEQSEFE